MIHDQSSTGLFAHAFALGLLFCLPPGPVFAETVHRGLRGGFVPACSVQLGSLAGDLFWAVLGLSGGATLLQWSGLQAPLAIAGVLLLAWLGVGSLREALAPPLPVPVDPARPADAGVDRSGLLTGAGLALSNPWNVVYWTAIAGTLPALGGNTVAWAQGVFLSGFMLACVAWCFGCAALVALTRRHLPPMAWRVLHALCGAGLLLFAALTAGRLLHE